MDLTLFLTSGLQINLDKHQDIHNVIKVINNYLYDNGYKGDNLAKKIDGCTVNVDIYKSDEKDKIMIDFSHKKMDRSERIDPVKIKLTNEMVNAEIDCLYNQIKNKYNIEFF